MGYQPFLIANTRVGTERDLEPWLLPDDAYPDLEDCYLWRGRVSKRQGFLLLGRLQRSIGTTNGGGSLSVTLPNTPLGVGNSQFQIATASPTVTDVYQDPSGANPATLLATNGNLTSTLNRSTGSLVINGATAAKTVNYFPGLPVMGLRSLESLVENQDNLIAFDTRFSYLFSAGAFQDLTFYKSSNASFIWHGSDSQFFWTANYSKAMFATNDVGGTDVHTYSMLTAGATTTITVTGDVTASFVVNDFVFIVPDTQSTTFPPVGTVTEFQGSGIITSSVFGGGNTTIIVAVATTGNSTTGVIFNESRNIGNGTTTGDSIKWLDQDQSGWVNFQPLLNGFGPSASYLQGALIVLPYKGYLICFNTIEGKFNDSAPKNFSQRARWCQNATPYYSNPVPTNYVGGVDPQAWRDDIAGKGDFIDAPTLEQIVSALYVKDTIIVYFERSTWQLRFTGINTIPFIWEKINTELGSQSTFSIVPFDKTTIAVGNVGIHACDTVNVERIDQKIPDEVFSIQNINQGPQRVYGIRDFFRQLVYWSMPYLGPNSEPDEASGQQVTYPNKILVYNYIDGSFSFFNDSFTCFGYFQDPTNPVLWSSNVLWGNEDIYWTDPINDAFALNVIGGNQQGFVEILMQQSFNDVSLFISNISGAVLTVPNNNLQPGQFVKITSASGMTSGIGAIFKVIAVTASTITLNQALTGIFTGSGSLTVVNNISILTKRFNPFISEDSKVRLGRADLYLDRTNNGQITVNLFINEDSTVPVNVVDNAPISTISQAITNITMATMAVISVPMPALFSVGDVIFITGVNGMTQINQRSAIVTSATTTTVTIFLDTTTFSAYTNGGTLWNVSKNAANVINTFPETTYQVNADKSLVNAKLWKRIQFYDISQLFQLQITYNDTQMFCESIVSEPLVLHGLILYASKSGRLIDV